MHQQAEQDVKTAWVSGIAAYTLWGAMPLFWRIFEGVDAFVVFLHRCLWSFPFLVLIHLLRTDKTQKLFGFDRGRLPWLVTSALLIGANWWIYIYGVHAHQVVEMSLGYFFSPLLSAAMGVLFLRERLTWGQWLGVASVVCGVALYSVNIGRLPVMAIGLALTFSLYSVVRKVVKVPPFTALVTEMFVLCLFAAFFAATNPVEFTFGEAWQRQSWLLMAGGALTALPLLWFAVAVRGISMTSMGMLNYISPTGKFLIATLLFHEVVTPVDFWAFGAIWTGIVLYLAFTYRRQRSPLQPE